MLLTEIQEKVVINVVDGSKLGHVFNLKLNATTGQIYHIIVKEAKGIFHIFSKKTEYVIPWDQIIKIGEDVVIVNYPDICPKKD